MHQYGLPPALPFVVCMFADVPFSIADRHISESCNGQHHHKVDSTLIHEVNTFLLYLNVGYLYPRID